MPIKIRINWDNENVVSESINIYRSNSYITTPTQAMIIALITGDIYEYEDLDVIEGQTYFYMLSTKLESQEVFSECYEVLAAPRSVDPDFSDVTLLMQFDGSNPLYDPASGATWTLYGDAFIDTSDKAVGGGALRISDAVSSYARSPVLTDMHNPQASGKALTVEFFFKKTSSIGNAGAVCFTRNGSTTDRYAFFIRSGSANLKCAVYSNVFSTFIDVTTPANLNEWNHFAFVEGGTADGLYINGARVYSISGSRRIWFWPETIAWIGQSGAGAEPYGGLIDGLRVTNAARYNGNFTPPDKPFPSQ
ncbi:LamG-like jellyroll fold domain-containing protein [Acinetobacter schindleri]|uniref:LamG-like jellyroll fold domain-containing protein n=1 Tax=Acinetobacter schindleri TaxID=108981 RepID=UPI003F575108